MIGRASTAMSIKIHQCTLKLTTMKLLYEMHLNKAISKAWQMLGVVAFPGILGLERLRQRTSHFIASLGPIVVDSSLC